MTGSEDRPEGKWRETEKNYKQDKLFVAVTL